MKLKCQGVFFLKDALCNTLLCLVNLSDQNRMFTQYMCFLLSKHMFLCICVCMSVPNAMPQVKPPLGHHGQTDLFNSTNKNQ